MTIHILDPVFKPHYFFALAQAVREARPTEGNGPDAGGSAFFGRTKNDGNNRKTNPNLSKTAQFPQVVGVAGFYRYFAALRLTVSNTPLSLSVSGTDARAKRTK